MHNAKLTHVEIFCNALKFLDDKSTLHQSGSTSSVNKSAGSTERIHQKRIARILDVSPSTLSRGIANPKSPPPSLKEKLSNSSTVKKIEAALHLPDLFVCKTIGEIKSLIDKHHGMPISTDIRELSSVEVSMKSLGGVAIQYRLSETESHALNDIGEILDVSSRPIALLQAESFSGANFISSLTHSAISSERFSSVCYLEPYPEENSNPEELKLAAFDYLNDTLTNLLGARGHYKVEMDNYINEMKSQRLLFVVKNFDHFDIRRLKQQGNFISCLIARLLQRRDISSPLVLLVGECRELPIQNNSIERINYSGNESLDSGKRMHFYEEQLDRFGEIRGSTISSRPFSTRVRRAKSMFYYETSARSQHTANEIRTLAFFASNEKIFSYFDPTNGFTELAGDIDLNLTLDIKEYHNEVNLYIRERAIRQSKRKTDLRILRYVSTSVYLAYSSCIR